MRTWPHLVPRADVGCDAEFLEFIVWFGAERLKKLAKFLHKMLQLNGKIYVKMRRRKNSTIIFPMHKLFQYWKDFITYKVLIFDRIIPSTFGPYKK